MLKLFFSQFDCNTRIGKNDFCVVQKPTKRVFAGVSRNTLPENKDIVSILWAEAKRSTVADIYKPLVQLILTIGRARTFDTYLPPPFLAAFDAEKIAFLPYREILPFLTRNDFNWYVLYPSDDSSREFGLLYGVVRDVLDRTAYVFRYNAHEKELREFIKQYLKVPSKPLPVGFTVQYSQVENFGSTTHAQPNANPKPRTTTFVSVFKDATTTKEK